MDPLSEVYHFRIINIRDSVAMQENLGQLLLDQEYVRTNMGENPSTFHKVKSNETLVVIITQEFHERPIPATSMHIGVYSSLKDAPYHLFHDAREVNALKCALYHLPELGEMPQRELVCDELCGQ